MDLARQIGGVAAVLALLAVTLWWLRGRGMVHLSSGKAKAPRRLELMERVPLTPQHSLHLVKLADRAILVAVSPSGCRLLESSAWTAVAGSHPDVEGVPR